MKQTSQNSIIRKFLDVAIDAVKKAGTFLRKQYGVDINYAYKKKDGSVVSQADIGSEQIILKILKKNFSEHGIFSEEAGEVGVSGAEYQWVIDPLDGTTNFTRTLEHFSISIALLRSGEPLVGVVYAPITDELFSAVSGEGTRCNNKLLSGGKINVLSQAVLSMARGHAVADRERHFKTYSHLAGRTRTVRILGSAALELCYGADGRLDVLLFNNVKLHDVAAGMLIAQEAGLMVTKFSGGSYNWNNEKCDIVVASPKLHKKILPLLQGL